MARVRPSALTAALALLALLSLGAQAFRPRVTLTMSTKKRAAKPAASAPPTIPTGTPQQQPPPPLKRPPSATASATAATPAPATSAARGASKSDKKASPFHCLIVDELGRPRSERPPGDGRSWHASMQDALATQLLEKASRVRSVSKDLLQEALHLLEYKSTHQALEEGAASPAAESTAALASALQGTWRLAFSSGEAFLKHVRRDRWGYLKDDVSVSIEQGIGAAAAISVQAFDKRFEGVLAPTERRGQLSLDFSRVQLLGNKKPAAAAKAEAEVDEASQQPMLAPGELKIVDAFLRPGHRLHLISVAASHLALRFIPPAEEMQGGADEEEGSLLILSRASAPVGAAAAAAAAAVAPAAKEAAAAAVVGKAKPQPEPKMKFKVRPKGTAANPYTSLFEYLEEECLSLFLVLSFPTWMKLMPGIVQGARFKFMLLHELFIEVSKHLPH